MLFSRKRTILYIDKGKILWARGWVPSGKIQGKVSELDWSEKNLQVALKDIADNFPGQARVVIGEDSAYASYLKKGAGKFDALAEAQARIPEKLKEAWDFQEKKGNVVQLIVIQEELFGIIKKFFLELGLKAEAIETESVALARILPAEKGEAVLFARRESKFLVGAVKDGVVLSAEVFSEIPDAEVLREFIDYVSKRCEVSLTRVFVPKGDKEIKSAFKDVGISIVEATLEPLIGISRKRDIKGRDADVLNIIFHVEKTEKTSVKGMALREKVLLAVFLSVIVIGSVLVYFLRR